MLVLWGIILAAAASAVKLNSTTPWMINEGQVGRSSTTTFVLTSAEFQKPKTSNVLSSIPGLYAAGDPKRPETLSKASNAHVVNGGCPSVPPGEIAKDTTTPLSPTMIPSANGVDTSSDKTPPMLFSGQESTALTPQNSKTPVSTQAPSTPAKVPVTAIQGTSHQSSPLSQAPTISDSPIISFGDVAYTATSSSAFVIGGKTLGPASPMITVSGTAFSLPPGGSQIIASVVGNPHGVSTAQIVTPSLRPPYATLTNSLLLSPIPVTAGQPLIIGGQTLTAGRPAVISGTTYSLAHDSSALAVGSSTIDLPIQSAYTTVTDAALPSPLMLTSGQPITIAGTTLTPGIAATISGTPYSLAPGSTAVVIGSSTIALSSKSSDSSGLGSTTLNGVDAASTGGSDQGSQAAYTTNASYTGPTYQGEGTAILQSWGSVWSVGAACVLAGMAVVWL